MILHRDFNEPAWRQQNEGAIGREQHFKITWSKLLKVQTFITKPNKTRAEIGRRLMKSCKQHQSLPKTHRENKLCSKVAF